MPELLTVSAAADWLGVGRNLLYRSLKAGQVPVVPIILGGTRYLARRHLEMWLESPAKATDTSEPGGGGSASYDELDELFSGRART